MSSKYLLIVLVFALFSCKNVNYAKDNHLNTNEVSPNLYKERYIVYNGGVAGGSVCSVYLTDSVKFRKYVGKHMDYEKILTIMISEDLVLVYKIKSDSYKILDAKIYSIPELKEEGKFE
ncbi:MAG: hypothetical protein PF448_08030 [Bacteroidales bacterium]|jgi:allophanate hydrolase subunit 1|nr:hypothetical protein [Bacteroidales bacterium]